MHKISDDQSCTNVTLITALASEILTSRRSTKLVHIKKKVQSVRNSIQKLRSWKKMQGYISENLQNKGENSSWLTLLVHTELVSLLDQASCLYVQSILESQEAVNSVVKQASERSCEWGGSGGSEESGGGKWKGGKTMVWKWNKSEESDTAWVGREYRVGKRGLGQVPGT
jgi:hypothetical protein